MQHSTLTIAIHQDGEGPTPTEQAEEERSVSKVWPLHLLHRRFPAASLFCSIPQPKLFLPAGRIL